MNIIFSLNLLKSFCFLIFSKSNRCLALLAFIISSFTAFSQGSSLPIYSDYLIDNYYLVHPSMAGASNYNKVRLTARQQWLDVKDALSLQTLSVNGRINDKVGLGGIFYNDSNGRFSQQGVTATFAYHLMFSRSTADLHQLSFGLSANILQDRFDQAGLNTIVNPDPAIYRSQRSETLFNADIGVSYFFLNFFAHVTFKNLLSQKRRVFSEIFETENQRQYLTSVGYTITLPESRW